SNHFSHFRYAQMSTRSRCSDKGVTAPCNKDQYEPEYYNTRHSRDCRGCTYCAWTIYLDAMVPLTQQNKRGKSLPFPFYFFNFSNIQIRPTVPGSARLKELNLGRRWDSSPSPNYMT